MTIKVDSSRTAAMEDAPLAFTHSPISHAFSAMTLFLAAHIEAERDLEHAGSWDIACDQWLRDAEAAREALLDMLAQVISLHRERAEDRPLQGMAMLIRAMVVSENAIEAAQLAAFATDSEALLRCPDDTPLARRVDAYLKTAQQQLVALRALPDYAFMIDGTCTEVPPEDGGGAPATPDVFEIPDDILFHDLAREPAAPAPAF